jgi:RHS repeat-associated protein
MVALTSATSNTSYTQPSPYAWLRSRAPVPTTYAPACEPLADFEEVLENRTSRARGITRRCTGVLVVRLEVASSYVIVFWESLTIHYNGESLDSRTGLYNFRARWYSASNGRFERLDPFAGNPNDPSSFNKYGFVHGNPVGGTYPTGLFALGLGGALITIAISSFGRGQEGVKVAIGRDIGFGFASASAGSVLFGGLFYGLGLDGAKGAVYGFQLGLGIYIAYRSGRIKEALSEGLSDALGRAIRPGIEAVFDFLANGIGAGENVNQLGARAGAGAKKVIEELFVGFS